jgi:c-di-GMP-binding flagellar brake protein YcgR
MDNRRKCRRIDLKIDVLHSTINAGHSVNLSESGLCLVTPVPFEQDQETTLLFHLTNNERKFIKTVGKITWNRKLSEGGYESGIEFKDMDDFYREKIHQFIGNSQ